MRITPDFKLKLAVGLGTILILMALLEVLNLISPVRSLALTITSPIYDNIYGLGNRISLIFATPSDLAELRQENERLREENSRLKVESSELEGIKKENLALRQLLDYFDNEGQGFPRVIAKVIGRDPENNSILILNVGRRDGIKVENAVVVKDGILVAKIREVYTASSKALLLTDSQSMVAAVIKDKSPTNKVARGDRGLGIILDQIPQQETLLPGQLIITSGLEPTIPNGLLIGEIEEKISESNDLFQTAILRPIVDYQTIREVAVITTPDLL